MYINTSSILYAYNKYSTQLANCHELRTHISMNVIDIHFSDNHQVIVADNLSKRLLESYLSDQRYQSGHLAHQTPDILDWWQWIDHTIEKSAPNCSWLQSYTVLSAQQEISLWHQIICLDAAENIPDSELIDLYALAKRASRSRLKQQQWNILGKSQNLISFVKDRPGHDLRYAIDASKINKELGWKPSVTFEEGLSKTIDWYLTHEDWLDNVTSGSYQNYYKSQYK